MEQHPTHASPISTLVRTLIALFVLLTISVLAARWHWGATSTFIALAIAAVKAVLVGVFFMDLRGSSPLSRLFAVAGLFWLLIMIMLTASDYFTRGW